ncbi:protein kinase domain-containing protein [Sorangium sp. So ce1389]|uniref:serine/threonine-protein kinase n=1 Tax=Sorangium sp. So ce1389 TaxID=3133336 RepID=UPI003F5F31F2
MKEGETVGGKFKLVQRLGKGGMGEVWEAVSVLDGRKVALKFIACRTDELRKRLLNEARLCGGLRHPNIVEIHEIGETDDKDPFLVMQLLTGETLADMLDRKKRIDPPALVARIGGDIASALDAAHSAKIIHRDLKPANIFLRREIDADERSFTVKVLDFGVSKSLNATGVQSTMTGLAVGSPAYMSPEQLSMSKRLDHRTDIWSLGIILYEMLTGMRPFRGATVNDVVHQVLFEPIRPVSHRLRSVPSALDELVARCLERDRDKRFPDATTLARALASIAEVNAVSRVIVDMSLPPTSHPERASVGSMPDADPASPRRAQMDFGLGGSPPALPWRPMATSSPASAVAECQESTLPLPQGTPVSPGATQAVTQAVGGPRLPPRLAPTGTQLMSPSAPIASPLPAWRREAQPATETRHPAVDTRSASLREVSPQDGTLAHPAEEALGHGAATGQVPGITTTIAPTARPAAEGAPASAPVSPRRGRDAGSWLYVAVGAGIVSTIAALVIVVMLGASSGETKPAEAPTASPGQAPLVTETPAVAPSAPSIPEAAPTTTADTAPTPSAEPTPSTTSQPAASGNAPMRPHAGAVRPPVKEPLRQPCRKFIKTPGCYEPKVKP